MTFWWPRFDDPSLGKQNPKASPLSNWHQVLASLHFLEPSSNEFQCLKLGRAGGSRTRDVLLPAAQSLIWPFSQHLQGAHFLPPCAGVVSIQAALAVKEETLFRSWPSSSSTISPPPNNECPGLPLFQCSWPLVCLLLTPSALKAAGGPQGGLLTLSPSPTPSLRTAWPTLPDPLPPSKRIFPASHSLKVPSSAMGYIRC